MKIVSDCRDMKWCHLAMFFIWTLVFPESTALQVSTRGSSSTVEENRSDLSLRCSAMFFNQEDELTRVTWYHLAPPLATPQEIFTLDLTREHPSYFFSSGWAERGVYQQVEEIAAAVIIVLPARFVTRKDSGIYRCQMQSLMSSGYDDTTVAVLYGPGTSLTLSPGGRVQRDEEAELTLSCSAECNPRCVYRWYRDGRIISSTSTLHIPSLSRVDTGLYACQARNIAGSSVKPVDVRVSFPAVVTSLSLITLEDNLTGNSRKNLNPLNGMNITNKTPHIIAGKDLWNSEWQFTVTLVCNVSGWPEPKVKWQLRRDLMGRRGFRDAQGDDLRFANMAHRWSYTEKSYIGIMANATCLDNGNYSCLSYNDDNSSFYPFPKSSSIQTVLLDLPCPPMHIQEVATQTNMNLEDIFTTNNGKKVESYKNLCDISSEVTETEMGVEVIVARFNATVSIRICFFGSPKPKVHLKRLSDGIESGITLSEIRWKQPELINRNQKISEKEASLLPQNNSNNTVLENLYISTLEMKKVKNVSKTTNERKDSIIQQNKPNQAKTKDEEKRRLEQYPKEPIVTTDYNINDIKNKIFYCSNSTNIPIEVCFINIDLAITSPFLYGYYELVAKNPHGESKKKYRIAFQQAPLSLKKFSVSNVSIASACFSWNAGFGGGEVQTFHLCYREVVGSTNKSGVLRSIENQMDIENDCVTIQSANVTDSKNEPDKNYIPHYGFTYSLCLKNLSSGTKYEASIFSSNHYGNSDTASLVYFRTNEKSVWATFRPIYSYLPSTTSAFNSNRQLPNSSTEGLTAEGQVTMRPMSSDHQEEKSESSELNESTIFTGALNNCSESDFKISCKENPPRIQLNEDVNSDNFSLKENDRENTVDQQYDEDFVGELLSNEDDLFYDKMNAFQFFQLLHAYSSLEGDYDDGIFDETATKPSLVSSEKKLMNTKFFRPRRQKVPPIHLQKLLLRYSKPHAKLRKAKTLVNTQNISFISNSSQNHFVETIETETTTTSHVLQDKEIMSSNKVKQYSFLAITCSASIAVSVLVIIFILFSLKWWCRRRRLKQMKQRYQRRKEEKATARRNFLSVEVEDANTTRNRLSSIRQNHTPLSLNLRAFPMLLPRQDAPDTIPPAALESKRQSNICVRNEQESSSFQRPFQRLMTEKSVLPQRQLRPTSSTPAIGKVVNQLSTVKGHDSNSANFSASSTPTGSKAHINVPTITIADDCGFSRKHPTLSLFPSYLDFQMEDQNLCLDLHPNRIHSDHLRPPSHHSSYTSVNQGSPLLRLDSFSSCTTGNYFNLYEGLVTKSQRSRSPSNIYDPLTFEAGDRSNPPSRQGSCVNDGARHGKTNLDAVENTFKKHFRDKLEASLDIPTSDVGIAPLQSNHSEDSGFRYKFETDSKPEPYRSVENRTSGQLGLTSISGNKRPKNTSNYLLNSKYERIVRQYPNFSKQNQLSIQRCSSFKIKKSRKNLACKHLASFSLPRTLEKNLKSNSVRKPSNIFDLKDSKRDNTSTSSSDKYVAGRNTVNKGVTAKTVSRVPLPPVPKIETSESLEESIYTDIDESLDSVDSKHNTKEDEKRLRNKKITFSSKKNSNSSITIISYFGLSGHLSRRTATTYKSQHPNNNTCTFETITSMDPIKFKNNQRHSNSNTPSRSRILTDCSPIGQQRLPDIMLCSENGSYSSGGHDEEEAYSTIDY